MTDKNIGKRPAPLIEGVDYHLNDDGLMVFTEKYHKERGECCESGCENCPYGFVRSL
jgi:hypothetical protein